MGSPHAKILGMPDSGFWPNSSGFASTFPAMLAMQNGTSGLMSACVAAHSVTGSVESCLFPEYFAPLIKTTLFPIQSLFDPLQKNCPGGPQVRGLQMLDQMNVTIFSK